ncbi:MAG: sucrose phosphorylase [Cyclobacteriaceae bacterium]
MKNQIQLIAYADRFGKKGIAAIQDFLESKLSDVFGGIHILPFYYPIDGADAGYDPIDHTSTDSKIGEWTDVKNLSGLLEITADLIVNHISGDSKEFKDVLKNGSQSPYFDLFITREKVFGERPSLEDIKKIYRPRPTSPFTEKKLNTGETFNFWTTFTSNQLDIDVIHEKGQKYLDNILNIFSANGIKMIRLDAAGYAIKKAGTSCFMLPETYDFIDAITQQAHDKGIKVLVEIHGHHSLQLDLSKRVDYVYDFALPPLVLHTLYTQSSDAIKKWLSISPRNVVTVLDTHDGIGIVDVAKEGDKEGILDGVAINQLVENIHAFSNNTSRMATGAAASNLDLYQVNCTYYDALGQDDELYYMARAIQFFSPGIPQVYYAGFLAAENDMGLLEKTQVGRDINRPYFSFNQIGEHINKPVVTKLIELMKFRNSHPSFSGIFNLQESAETSLSIKWTNDSYWSQLNIDLVNKQVEITFGDGQKNETNLRWD